MILICLNPVFILPYFLPFFKYIIFIFAITIGYEAQRRCLDSKMQTGLSLLHYENTQRAVAEWLLRYVRASTQKYAHSPRTALQ